MRSHIFSQFEKNKGVTLDSLDKLSNIEGMFTLRVVKQTTILQTYIVKHFFLALPCFNSVTETIVYYAHNSRRLSM